MSARKKTAVKKKTTARKPKASTAPAPKKPLSQAALYKKLAYGQTVIAENMDGWKKAFYLQKDVSSKKQRSCIIQLQLPKGARVNVKNGKGTDPKYRKCRVEKANIIAFFDMNGNPLKITTAFSRHNNKYTYKIGQKKVIKNYSLLADSCAEGIHFFFSRRDAKRYYFT